MNAVALLRVKSNRNKIGLEFKGYIRVGWYPSAVAAESCGDKLLIANAKGTKLLQNNGIGDEAARGDADNDRDDHEKGLSGSPVRRHQEAEAGAGFKWAVYLYCSFSTSRRLFACRISFASAT